MDGDGCFYLLAFVTEEEGSATHLCKFDAEGNPVYDTDISGETDNADLLTDFLMEIEPSMSRRTAGSWLLSGIWQREAASLRC